MKNLPLLISTIVGSLILVVGVAFFFSAPTEKKAQAVDQNLVLGKNTEVSADKPTVAVFSDFECPACATLEETFLRDLKIKYQDRVNFVFRQFPLSIHPFAKLAAAASLAAGEQGKFWQYHDLLFANQGEWSALTSKDQVRDQFIEYALELEIDKADFIEKMESEDIKKRIAADVADGFSLKVNSTPTVYLNNNKTAPQDLSAQIELLLQDK